MLGVFFSGKQTVSSYLAPIAVKILKEIVTESGSKYPKVAISFATNKKLQDIS